MVDCLQVLFQVAAEHAIIQPLLKKANHLDSFDMNNFRPISKLSFISEILEKIVFAQLNDFYS